MAGSTILDMPSHHVPKPGDRVDVEVVVEGQWRPGELRMQTQLDDGSWQFQVQWQPAGSTSRCIDTFRAEDVRPERDGGVGALRPPKDHGTQPSDKGHDRENHD